MEDVLSMGGDHFTGTATTRASVVTSPSTPEMLLITTVKVTNAFLLVRLVVYKSA